MEYWLDDTDKGKPNYSENLSSIAPLSVTDPTLAGLDRSRASEKQFRT